MIPAIIFMNSKDEILECWSAETSAIAFFQNGDLVFGVKNSS
jgi:hypothetical protein